VSRSPRRGTGHEITCRQAVRLINSYLDGSLEPDEQARLETHLGECDLCSEHLRHLRITVAVTGRLREEDLDPQARQDLIALYRRWKNDQD
jgi:anti-sigma factor RsiW